MNTFNIFFRQFNDDADDLNVKHIPGFVLTRSPVMDMLYTIQIMLATRATY